MNDILQKIKNHALSKSSEEVCGFLVMEENKVVVIHCQNVSSTPEKRFEIHPETYLETKLRSEIIAIYHSHPSDASFSRDDILAAESYALPCMLYINPTKEFDAYYPKYAESKHIERVRGIIND
tara:strand:- start:45 stop:416 length:372 start_codon:yes stop_codon:yes gene_type:complete